MKSPRIETSNLGKNLGNRWVLRRIDLRLEEGEILGVIGANGAGKSTLLKTLSGLLHPDEGSYRIKGSMASLLEVGTGFHPDLSGRENAFLRGALLGLSRAEVRELLPIVTEFAGVSDRIDEPVKYYSSGMQVRLGFALAAHLPADVLVVDEVLAVGDAAFQAKSLAFLESTWRQSARSVVYVAHQLPQVRRLCDRVLWLDQGLIRMEGPADAVCDAYAASQKSISPEWAEPERRRGQGKVRATALSIQDQWVTGGTAKLQLHWKESAPSENLDLRISVEAADGSAISLWSSLQSGKSIASSQLEAHLTLSELGLSSGDYLLHLRLFADGLLQDEVLGASTLTVVQGLWKGLAYPTPRPMALQSQDWN